MDWISLVWETWRVTFWCVSVSKALAYLPRALLFNPLFEFWTSRQPQMAIRPNREFEASLIEGVKEKDSYTYYTQGSYGLTWFDGLFVMDNGSLVADGPKRAST